MGLDERVGSFSKGRDSSSLGTFFGKRVPAAREYLARLGSLLPG